MDTNTLLIIIVLVLLLGGGGWYAPISAIALAPSRMPRIYSRRRLIRQGSSLLQQALLRWSRLDQGCLEIQIVMDFFSFWPEPLARISTEFDKTLLASNKMLQPRKRL